MDEKRLENELSTLLFVKRRSGFSTSRLASMLRISRTQLIGALKGEPGNLRLALESPILPALIKLATVDGASPLIMGELEHRKRNEDGTYKRRDHKPEMRVVYYKKKTA